jgi:hypothetical protein
MGKIGADGMFWKRSDFYVSFMGVTGSAYHFRQNHHRSSQLLRGSITNSRFIDSSKLWSLSVVFAEAHVRN